MNKKELENMARECLTITAWCVRRLPVSEWPDWVILLLDLLAAQDDEDRKSVV